MTDAADRLDAAIAGQPARDEETKLLMAELDLLEPLRAAPPRSSQSEQAGLRAFISEANNMRPAVSAPRGPRRTGWTFTLTKEGSPMFALAVKLMLALALSVGGAGATTLAAQGSQPNDLLYPVKLITEDVRLALASDSQARIDLLLEQAQVRTTELAQLAALGQSIPEAVPLRLQTHLETALQTAAQLADPQMQAALEQIRAEVQTQAQIMAHWRENAPAEVRLRLRTAERAMTQTRELCELGLSEPQLLRERLTANRPDSAPDQPEIVPGAGNGPQTTPCGDCTPEGNQNQYGPGPQSTSCGDCTPHGDPHQNQYRPGPQATPCGDCTPEGDQNQYGPGPQPIDTPEPGDGHGPGPQSTEPPGEGNPHGPGPEPTNTSGSGKP